MDRAARCFASLQSFAEDLAYLSPWAMIRLPDSQPGRQPDHRRLSSTVGKFVSRISNPRWAPCQACFWMNGIRDTSHIHASSAGIPYFGRIIGGSTTPVRPLSATKQVTLVLASSTTSSGLFCQSPSRPPPSHLSHLQISIMIPPPTQHRVDYKCDPVHLPSFVVPVSQSIALFLFFAFENLQVVGARFCLTTVVTQ